ncbi:putative F-box domain-containing protein [Arabidopsis thaliana]
MDSGKTFDSISNDLFLEILLRFSTKSIARSRCVSKQWASILCSQDFTELWRKIKCPLPHEPFWKEICINGVLYYSASSAHGYLLIVSFDFRSEKFNFINASSFLFSSTKLINYKGKLGGIDLAYNHGGVYPVELRMWVLEDVEKHEWSRHVYSLPETIEFQQCNYNICVVEMNAIGEIVFSESYTSTSKPFYVFYFNPEKKNTLRC